MTESHIKNQPLAVKPYFWLVFSLYYFMPMFFTNFGPTHLTLFLSAYVLFVICYLWACQNLINRTNHWPILGIVALAIGASFLSTGSDSFFSYAGLFVGLGYPLRIFFPAIAALVATTIFLGLIHDYPFPFLTLTGSFGVVTLGLLGVAERLRTEMYIREQRSREEIQQLAMIAERERIARDLHDILGHSLSSIALKAELAEKLIGQNNTAGGQTHLSELNQIARESLQLVRQTVSGYKHRGLSGEVMELCERMRQNNFTVTLEGEVPSLNPKAETTLILVLTELTTNILRHSRGNECHLEFNRDKEQFNISVTDNGANARIEMGNGLLGIRERLSAFNGDLHIDTSEKSRFTIALPTSQMRPA